MKRNRLLLFLLVFVAFLSCKKNSESKSTQYGAKVNTWTFKEGSNQFSGTLLFDAELNTLLQSNNSYTFGIIGAENNSGYIFNIVLSLLDLDFTEKNYQSGVDGNDYLNAFYYTESVASPDNIYKSSNYDPGPVMNYTVTSYDAPKDIVTITFSGKAQLANGSFVDITEGKVTAQIER
jgi:hypothetical protein